MPRIGRSFIFLVLVHQRWKASLRGMSMCDAGYSGRTVKIVKELREKFDLARSDHNRTFAHPVRCMDPLRSTLHKIHSQHAPAKLSRVDEILSKHEGHGQLLLCALICKYNQAFPSNRFLPSILNQELCALSLQ